MPAEPYTGTQAEHSSDLPACSRACREVSHTKKKREKVLHPNLRGAEQARWARSVGNSTVENFCIVIIIIRYVCIEYDGKAYPGFVEDADLAQVYVSCMHSVGKEMLNCFFWPFFFSPRCELVWSWSNPSSHPKATLLQHVTLKLIMACG